MQFLKANTGVDVRMGPFVDVGDGFTPETAVGNTPTNLTGVDEAELLKHDGAATSDITTRTWAAISSCDGWYDLTLTTGDTDTEGLLEIVIQDDTVCLPVHARFMVLSAAAYDSMFAVKDAGFMDINIKTVGRADAQETEANNLESACANYSATRGLTGTAVPAAAAEAAGGLYTRGTGAGQINQDGNGRVDTNITFLGGAAVQSTTGHIHAYDDAGNTLLSTNIVNVANGSVEADITYIHGSALTETAGQLAGRFVDFFDHAAATFTLNTALADFKATGFAVASDVTTAHATTDGLIGTPTDFGSGTSTVAANLQDIADNGTAVYDRATDSLQALRDQGDAAWTTATSVTVSDKTGFSLVDGSIAAATFSANAITSTVVADNTITAAKINADAITNAKIADDAIAAENLATGALTADAFAADALVAATFATGAFTADAFAADALIAATFATGAFTADAFAANALVAATFATSSLDDKGNWNTVVPDASGVAPTAAEIYTEFGDGSNLTTCATATSVTVSDKTGFSLLNGSIVAATFAANAITSTVVADNTITAAKINADAITSAKIADDAIATEHIATGALTADSFAVDALVATTFATGAFTADAFAADALIAATFATDSIAADALAADAVTEIQSGLATATNVTTAHSTTDGLVTTVDTEVDAIRVVTDALTAAAAAKLEKSAKGIIPGTVDTVINGHTPTTTEFQADDITEATANHFLGAVVVFTSGVLLGQRTDITAYSQVGGIGQFTTTTLTDPPANNDTFVII